MVEDEGEKVREVPAGVHQLYQAVRRVFRRFETSRSTTGAEHQATWDLHVRVFPDELDGGFVAECIELPGCVSDGDTEDEAIENVRDAIVEVLLVRLQEGLTAPTQSEPRKRPHPRPYGREHAIKVGLGA